LGRLELPKINQLFGVRPLLNIFDSRRQAVIFLRDILVTLGKEFEATKK
jgi:hypothetical protein